MVMIHPEYVVDAQQHRKAVLLPVVEWEQIVDELEELDDIRAYDQAKASSHRPVRVVVETVGKDHFHASGIEPEPL